MYRATIGIPAVNHEKFMPIAITCPWGGNVGDILSLPIARRFLGKDTIAVRQPQAGQVNVVLVGSILDCVTADSHVCGAGLISPDQKVPAHPAAIYAVRGPLTRLFLLQRYGIKAPEIYGDPAVLLPDILPPAPEGVVEFECGVIPHYVDASHPAVEDMRRQGAHILDVRWSPPQFIHELQRCQTILSSSLHGIILAHTYQRAALWVDMTKRLTGKGFKFFDYYLSLGISPERVVRVQLRDSNTIAPLLKLAKWHSTAELEANLRPAMTAMRKAVNMEINQACSS
jgi:pyruvyltransferase